MEPTPSDLEQLVSLVRERCPNGDPLQHLTEALVTAGELEEIADELIGRFVEEARAAGSTWAEIGETMGVTRQAAQQRFVKEKGKRGMFTRFAASSRSVVRRAVSHAHRFGNDHVGTEHLLLGLIEDADGTAAAAITGVGGNLDGLRGEIESVLESQRGSGTKRHIPFSADSKKVLEISLREAVRDRSPGIETGHILLALLRDARSPGGQILSAAGITRSAVTAWLAAA